MASSSGGDVPAERAAAAVSDLTEARKGAARLRSSILEQEYHRAAEWVELVDGVMSRLSSAMSAMDVTGVAAGGRSQAAGSDGAGQSVSSSGNPRKRSFSRRSQGSSNRKITATLDDGYIWRKYGQKEIQNSPHPRSYFRCTHKSDQGCNAKRHVQVCETDPSKYVVTYYGEHTCREPSTIPIFVHTAGAAPDRPNNLISFASSCANTAATSTGGASSQLAVDGSTTQLSTSWCTSDDVFSSSAGSFMQVDELGAVVGSAGMTSTTASGSAADCGGLGGRGAGAGSFPSSPNSLGLMVGSLGSMGGDDFFRLNLDHP